jgi:hypothetical protein
MNEDEQAARTVAEILERMNAPDPIAQALIRAVLPVGGTQFLVFSKSYVLAGMLSRLART